MKFYLEQLKSMFEALNTSETGLSESEAQQRLSENGKNKLDEGKKISLFSRFVKQLLDPMIIILIAAAVVSGITSSIEGHGLTDAIIILAVVIINSVLGVYQESKAEKAIEALQQMSAATSKVLRNDTMMVIKSEDLVVGDVIILEAGDAVPADARIIECASLQIEEAALTGESVPVNKMIDALMLNDGVKDISLGDRKNMVYMGSTVVYGRGKAIVTAVGMDTEMGKIAHTLSMVTESKTPLQKKLSQLSHVLTYVVLGICVVIFAIGILRAGSFAYDAIIDSFMVAVSLAVAAIPEGLAAVVTIVLSMGVTNMSKQNAIIRKLTAVETLGCAEIICSDKTGTLTQNKMTVVEEFTTDKNLLALAMALASDANIGASGQAEGEPTECALVNYANSLGINKAEIEDDYPRVGEAPFDSMRKMMSTVHKTKDGIVQYTKGAPDELLKCCTHYLDKDGKTVALTEEYKKQILDSNKEMANKALRVLASAQKVYDKQPTDFSPAALEQGLCYIGQTGMIDPVRPEVMAAVEECRKAGIRPIMITGDHKDTAVAIAKSLGIITDESQAITGAMLEEISEQQLIQDIEKYSVYARVQPEHKVRIVKAWKSKGFVTAMTGDGVNDAPSIKSADIGIGMGITGTDVTKNVADMVLTDDNFATIVGAVKQGRRIYDNIRKSIQFLLSSNMSEVISVFVATMLGFVILQPIHLLWINLITDTFPALALGTEKEEPGLMSRPPRNRNDGIFSGGVGVDVIYQGLLVACLTLTSYFIGHYIESGVWEIANSKDGITMAFLTMSLAEIFHSFSMRSQRKSIFSLKNQNLMLWGGGIVSLILTICVLYVPFLQTAFGFEPISLAEFGISAGLACLMIPIVEIVKACQRAYAKSKTA